MNHFVTEGEEEGDQNHYFAYNVVPVSLIWPKLHTNMRPDTTHKLICRFSKKQDGRRIQNGCRKAENWQSWDILACNSDTVSLIFTKLHTNNLGWAKNPLFLKSQSHCQVY